MCSHCVKRIGVIGYDLKVKGTFLLDIVDFLLQGIDFFFLNGFCCVGSDAVAGLYGL